MVDRIGSGGASRAALDSLIEKMREKKAELAGQQEPAKGAPSFSQLVRDGVTEVDTQVKATESLALDAIKGEIELHEVAARIKQSELSFDFALQVRNKFIEAYREVMRMNV